MIKCIVVLLLLAAIPSYALAQADVSNSALQLRVLYDNVPFDKQLSTDWGFACLVTGAEKSILFDTGAKGDVLLANLRAMKVQPGAVDVVVISHCHGDHTGGLLALLKERGGVPVYLPASAGRSLVDQISAATSQCEVVNRTTVLCPGVVVLGPIGSEIVEQALVVDTPHGLVIITGCSHPGIVEMTRRAKEHFKDRDVYMVCGGMHLLRHSDKQLREVIAELKELGVKKVGATHCTGDKAIRLFQQAFGEDYVSLGAGRTLKL